MIIIGAGNLGKHIIDQLEQDEYKNELTFFDENEKTNLIYNKYPVIHNWDELYKILQSSDNEFFIAIGNPRLRHKLLNKLEQGKYISLISKHAAVVSTYSLFGDGTLIQPACCISHNVKTGKSCLVHANTLIGHDVIIDDFVSIGSNVNILKGVEIGTFSVISPNVLIYPNIKIGRNVFIAPGVIVKNDVEDFQTLNLNC